MVFIPYLNQFFFQMPNIIELDSIIINLLLNCSIIITNFIVYSSKLKQVSVNFNYYNWCNHVGYLQYLLVVLTFFLLRMVIGTEESTLVEQLNSLIVFFENNKQWQSIFMRPHPDQVHSRMTSKKYISICVLWTSPLLICVGVTYSSCSAALKLGDTWNM